MTFLLWTGVAFATVVTPCIVAYLFLPQSDGRVL